jgi:hypothetical protein
MMAIEIVRNRQLTANDDKPNGARLLAVDNTIRAKSMQECYNAVVQVTAQSQLILPTAATNLANIRYLYLETTDTIQLDIDGATLRIEPLVANNLAVFEADLNCSQIKLINSDTINIRVHVFVAGDTA